MAELKLDHLTIFVSLPPSQDAPKSATQPAASAPHPLPSMQTSGLWCLQPSSPKDI